MKVLASAMVLLAAGSVSASAADLPVKALQSAPPIYDWSGVYVGAHAGYGGGMKDWPSFNAINAFGADFIARGGFGGGQVGINKQLGSLVVGVELEGAWADISGSQNKVFGGPAFNFQLNSATASKIDSVATFAGRMGLAADRWFVFAKGGLAWAHERHSLDFTLVQPAIVQTAVVSSTESRVAPLLGFGAEYAVGDNWSIKAEYDYVHLGSRNVGQSGTATFNAVAFPVSNVSMQIEQAIHLAKVGVNYRLGRPSQDSRFASVPTASVWSGGYVGVEAGYGFGRTAWPDFFDPANPASGRFNVDGGLAGATLGANVQSGHFLFGVEGDWMWSAIRGNQNIPFTGALAPGGTILDSKVNWLATASGRAGFVIADKLLLFGKAGVAVADERHSLNQTVSNPTGAVSLSGSAVHTGIVVGAGAEYALGGNWSIKAEYDYIKMSDQAFTGVGTASGGLLIVGSMPFTNQFSKQSQDLQLVKFGANYHFNPGSTAVSARY